jgi:hypothetical protein
MTRSIKGTRLGADVKPFGQLRAGLEHDLAAAGKRALSALPDA